MKPISAIQHLSVRSNRQTSITFNCFMPHQLAVCLTAIALASGCQTTSTPLPPQSAQVVPTQPIAKKLESLILREGDVVKISIPGATNLDATQTIQRDGKISLALIGQVKAAGLKLAELQLELTRLYAPQLVSKEINVSVISSSFPTFVTGAVLRPGKIISDHPITALEAIMEAGGPDYARANLKAVVVIRQKDDGKTQNHTLDLKLILEGKQDTPFFLKPSDIVFVPERFAWF